MTGSNCRPDD